MSVESYHIHQSHKVSTFLENTFREHLEMDRNRSLPLSFELYRNVLELPVWFNSHFKCDRYILHLTFLPASNFFIVEGGKVFIRDWRTHAVAQSAKANSKRKPPPSGALKTRLCWFHTHHPHGCPLAREVCAFAHGDTELRPSTKPPKMIRTWMGAFYFKVDVLIRLLLIKHSI